MKAIRVLLVDDHALVRAGFRALLQNLEGIEIVGEAGDGAEALDKIAELLPEVVLMDLIMPRLNGLDALARIRKEYPQVHVLIVSMNAAEEFVLQAMRAGAAGYLVKSVEPAELQFAIRAVARGEKYLSSGVAKHVIDDYLRRAAGAESNAPDLLTPRQREILQLIAEGHSTKEIAQKLGLSANTVDSHRTQLMKSLDIHDIAGLVRYAIRNGLTSVDA